MKKIISFTIIFFAITLYAKDNLKLSTLEKMVKPKVSLKSSYISDSNLDGYDGGVEVQKNTLKINNKFFGFSYSNTQYKWNNISALPFGNGNSEPIEQMHTFKADIKLPYKINHQWFLINSFSIKSSFENDTQDSYSAGIFSFASYKYDDKHTIQIGAFANYHPTASIVMPIISYSYRIRHYNGFKFVLGFPRTYVGYHLNRATLLRFGMIYSQSVAKLNKNSTLQKDGYIETKDYMSNIGISYDFSKKLTIEADALYGLNREFTIYDSNSHKTNSYKIKPSLGASIKVIYMF